MRLCIHRFFLNLSDSFSFALLSSVRIDSKTVVFIRANPGKKPQTDQVRMHFLSGSAHFSGSAKFQKMARDQKFKFAVFNL